ncbi:FAD binding domain-containing protein [Alcaligenaceae bacterium C4P045]|nr:FAD binding domain-containing protein [Alcaligenaceae bacterium C4P045]
MKPVAYTLERHPDLLAACAQLASETYTKPIAGGQSLGAMLNLRLAQPEALVDLDAVAALHRCDEDAHGVTLGAMTPHAAIEDRVVPDVTQGFLPKVARGIAYRAVRNRGTVGGSLCHADPAADWITAMAAAGAVYAVHSAAGTRHIDAGSFMVSAFETQLAPDELLTAVHVPRLSADARWAYAKFCRKTGEFALAIVAVVIDPARDVARWVVGALDGAPRVFDDPRLATTFADPLARAAWLADPALDLDTTRRALLDDLIAQAVREIHP